MLEKNSVSAKLAYMTYLNRENQFKHFDSYSEDMRQYHLLAQGKDEALTEGERIFEKMRSVSLSKDTLQSSRYMFIANATLATRFVIEAGVETEKAYNISDLFIHQMDEAKDFTEIKGIQQKMIAYFLKEVKQVQHQRIFSKPVMTCLDYIDQHLHEKISVPGLSDSVNLSPNYLSRLFKDETGMTITSYINNQRIRTAENMIRYSDYNFTEISQILAFGNQTYFNRQFKKQTGLSPSQYRKHCRPDYFLNQPADRD
ncbi:TPA: helix-turn-helix transcriptional regulator [Streptococcus suis]|nr:helix-turn-helix transcriptional regulator [Streptococcus suis]